MGKKRVGDKLAPTLRTAEALAAKHGVSARTIIRDGQRASGGVFAVNDEGYGVLEVSSPDPLASYSAFGVTIEPEGGSPGPTGDKVLDGGL